MSSIEQLAQRLDQTFGPIEDILGNIKNITKQRIHDEVTCWRNARTINDDLEEDYDEDYTSKEMIEILKEMVQEGTMEFWPENSVEPTGNNGQWRSIPNSEGIPKVVKTGEKTGRMLLEKDKKEEEEWKIPHILKEAQRMYGSNPTQLRFRSRSLGWELATITRIDGEYFEGKGDYSNEIFRLWIGHNRMMRCLTPDELLQQQQQQPSQVYLSSTSHQKK